MIEYSRFCTDWYIRVAAKVLEGILVGLKYRLGSERSIQEPRVLVTAATEQHRTNLLFCNLFPVFRNRVSACSNRNCFRHNRILEFHSVGFQFNDI